MQSERAPLEWPAICGIVGPNPRCGCGSRCAPTSRELLAVRTVAGVCYCHQPARVTPSRVHSPAQLAACGVCCRQHEVLSDLEATHAGVAVRPGLPRSRDVK